MNRVPVFSVRADKLLAGARVMHGFGQNRDSGKAQSSQCRYDSCSTRGQNYFFPVIFQNITVHKQDYSMIW